MLTDAKGQLLVTGAGPVNGPVNQASELAVSSMVWPHHWNTSPTCTLLRDASEWECDSQYAIARTESLTTLQYRLETSRTTAIRKWSADNGIEGIHL